MFYEGNSVSMAFDIPGKSLLTISIALFSPISIKSLNTFIQPALFSLLKNV
jgi:hypothetical protein